MASHRTDRRAAPLTPQEKKEAVNEIRALRERRVAEKAELQDLNTRLEIVLNHLDSRDRRIDDLTNERDELQQELNDRSNRWAKTLDDAAKKWADDATRIKAENRELADNANTLRAQNERLKAENENSKGKLKQLAEILPQVDELKTQLQAQEEKYDMQLENVKDQLADKEKALREREDRALARENNMKQEMDKQRLQDIKAVEDRCEMDRAQQIEKFRQDWNRQIGEKERLIDQLKGECGNLREELAGRNKELKQLQKQLRDAMQRFEDASKNRDSLRNLNGDELTRLRNQVQEMGNAFARKNLQFDELMEQKIALQQEIAMYRALVSRAERAHDIQTPPRKRYRPDNSLHSSAPPPSRRRVHLQFGGGDVEEGYVELLNHGRASVPLTGLSLRSSSGASLQLNSKQENLAGTKSLRVYLREPTDGRAPPDALIWEGAWDGASKCEVKVVNARGQNVCGLTLDPAMFGDEDARCYVM